MKFRLEVGQMPEAWQHSEIFTANDVEEARWIANRLAREGVWGFTPEFVKLTGLEADGIEATWSISLK